jgi:hypothetical protein
VFNYFKPGYGLVTKQDPNSENCNLFYSELVTLKKPISDVDSFLLHNMFTNNMILKYNCKRDVFNRRSGNDTRSVSQDEISGWVHSSYLLNTEHKKIIWNHLISHFGSYNNTGKLMDYLPFNPANYYSWGILCDSWLAYLFLPFYVINLIIALSKEANNTSTKILYWLDMVNMPQTFINKILKKFYVYRMKKQYGEKYINSILRYYFYGEDKDFPIFVELDKRGNVYDL